MIPLSAVAHFTQGATPLAVNHQGLLVATTISFNLPPGVSLSTAVATIDATMNRIGVPATIRGTFQGTAKAFQDSLDNQPFLILAALVTIYIVLGMLYESYVHPADDPVHPAVGRRRRPARPDGVPHRVQHHGADRRHPADRHRQEERHHDDRFRARRRAQARAQPARRDLRGLPAALPADHDDDHGGDARRAAAGDRHGRRRRASPAARHRHRRRADPQPGADALYDAGDLPLHGSVPALEPAAPGRSRRRPRGRCSRCNRANRCQQLHRSRA